VEVVTEIEKRCGPFPHGNCKCRPRELAVGGREFYSGCGRGDPGRTGAICATRAEAVPSNPDRKQGPTRSGPSPHFLVCFIGKKKNGQLTSLTVFRSLAFERGQAYARRYVLRARKANRLFDGGQKPAQASEPLEVGDLSRWGDQVRLRSHRNFSRQWRRPTRRERRHSPSCSRSFTFPE
jgi:hypothetical protein